MRATRVVVVRIPHGHRVGVPGARIAQDPNAGRFGFAGQRSGAEPMVRIVADQNLAVGPDRVVVRRVRRQSLQVHHVFGNQRRVFGDLAQRAQLRAEQDATGRRHVGSPAHDDAFRCSELQIRTSQHRDRRVYDELRHHDQIARSGRGIPNTDRQHVRAAL